MNHSEACGCHAHSSEIEQTISEMEFERGIWNAAIYNEVDRIKSFISMGKANDKDNFGYTALHYAARNGNETICKLLLKDGRADVNATTKGGATALHRAAMMGHLNVVKLLMEFNAEASIQDEDGQTALHRAAQNNRAAVCEYLCDPILNAIKDKKGKMAFEMVSSSNNDLKILLQP